jgi:hypothetical protein
MKWISTTIKKKWMDLILDGTKCAEYKANTKFWNKRLEPLVDKFFLDDEIGINFLCGQKSYKYRVVHIRHHNRHPLDIDGVQVTDWYEIQLGKRIT